METNKPILLMALAVAGTGTVLAENDQQIVTAEQLQAFLSQTLEKIGTYEEPYKGYAQSIKDKYLPEGSALKNEILDKISKGTLNQDAIDEYVAAIEKLFSDATTDEAEFAAKFQNAKDALAAVAKAKADAKTAYDALQVKSVKDGNAKALSDLDKSFGDLKKLDDDDDMKTIHDSKDEADKCANAANELKSKYDKFVEDIKAAETQAIQNQKDLNDAYAETCKAIADEIAAEKTTIAGYMGIDGTFAAAADAQPATLAGIESTIAAEYAALTLDSKKSDIDKSIKDLQDAIANNLADALAAAQAADLAKYNEHKAGIPGLEPDPADGEDDIIKAAQKTLNDAIKAEKAALEASHAAMTTIKDLEQASPLKTAVEARILAQKGLQEAKDNLAAYKDLTKKYNDVKDSYDEAIIALSSEHLAGNLDDHIFDDYNAILSQAATDLAAILKLNNKYYGDKAYEEGLLDAQYDEVKAMLDAIPQNDIDNIVKLAQAAQDVYLAAQKKVNDYQEQLDNDIASYAGIPAGKLVTELNGMADDSSDKIGDLSNYVEENKVSDGKKETAVETSLSDLEGQIAAAKTIMADYKEASDSLSKLNQSLAAAKILLIDDPTYKEISKAAYEAGYEADTAAVNAIQAKIDALQKAADESIDNEIANCTADAAKADVLTQYPAIAKEIADLTAKIKADMDEYWKWMNMRGDVAAYNQGVYLFQNDSIKWDGVITDDYKTEKPNWYSPETKVYLGTLRSLHESSYSLANYLNTMLDWSAEKAEIQAYLDAVEAALKEHVTENHAEAMGDMDCIEQLKGWADSLKVAEQKIEALEALAKANNSAFQNAENTLKGIKNNISNGTITGLPKTDDAKYGTMVNKIVSMIDDARKTTLKGYYYDKKCTEFPLDAIVAEINNEISYVKTYSYFDTKLVELKNKVTEEQKNEYESSLEYDRQIALYTQRTNELGDKIEAAHTAKTSVSQETKLKQSVETYQKKFAQIEKGIQTNYAAYVGMFSEVDTSYVKVKPQITGDLDPESYYSKKLAALKSELEDTRTEFRAHFDAAEAAKYKAETANKAAELNTAINAVLTDAKANLAAYNKHLDIQHEAKLDLSPLYAYISETYTTESDSLINAEKFYHAMIDELLVKINANDKQVVDWYKNGQSDANKDAISYSFDLQNIRDLSDANKGAFDNQMSQLDVLEKKFDDVKAEIQAEYDNAIDENKDAIKKYLDDLAITEKNLKELKTTAIEKVNAGESESYMVKFDTNYDKILLNLNNAKKKAKNQYNKDVDEYNKACLADFKEAYNKCYEKYNSVYYEIQKYGLYTFADFDESIEARKEPLFTISNDLHEIYAKGIDVVTDDVAKGEYTDKNQENKAALEGIEKQLDDMLQAFYAETQITAKAAFDAATAEMAADLDQWKADLTSLSHDTEAGKMDGYKPAATYSGIVGQFGSWMWWSNPYSDKEVSKKLAQYYSDVMADVESKYNEGKALYNSTLAKDVTDDADDLAKKMDAVDLSVYSSELTETMTEAIEDVMATIDAVKASTLDDMDPATVAELQGELADAEAAFNAIKAQCDADQEAINADAANKQTFDDFADAIKANKDYLDNLSVLYPESVEAAKANIEAANASITADNEANANYYKEKYTAATEAAMQAAIDATKDLIDEVEALLVEGSDHTVATNINTAAWDLVDLYNRAQANVYDKDNTKNNATVLVPGETANYGDYLNAVYEEIDALLKAVAISADPAQTKADEAAIAAKQDEYNNKIADITAKICKADPEQNEYLGLVALIDEVEEGEYAELVKLFEDSEFKDDLLIEHMGVTSAESKNIFDARQLLEEDHLSSKCGKKNAQFTEKNVENLKKLINDDIAAVKATEAELKAAKELAEKTAANNAAYSKLKPQIDAMEGALTAAWNDMQTTSAVDTWWKFSDTKAAIKAAISAKSEELEADKAAIKLTAESTLDLTEIDNAIKQMKADAAAAQATFTADENAAYAAAKSAIDQLKADFNAAAATIATYDESVQKDFAAQITKLEGDIAAEAAAIESAKAAKQALVNAEKFDSEIKALQATLNALIDAAETAQDPFNFKPGDISGDGEVDVNDVNSIIDLVYDSSELVPGTKEFNAADVNGDGVIDIADLVATINLYVYGPDGAPKAASIRFNDAAATFADAVVLNAAEGRITFGLDNKCTYAGVQMDVVLPEGMSIEECVLGAQAAGHIVDARQIGENTWRILLFSMTNDEIGKNANSLFDIVLGGDSKGGLVAFDNIHLVSASGISYLASAIGVDVEGTTGIRNKSIATDAEFFTVDGAAQDGLKKGVNIIRNADGTTSKVLVK